MKEELHIIPHDHKINKEGRNTLNRHKSFVIWFTGLSGSGKSTVANALEQQLYERNIRTYILDGDNVRAGLNSDLDFTEEGRVENIRRIGEVANLFVQAGVVTLSAFVSPFKTDREKVKQTVGAENFIEVFVSCPIEVCEERDVKGLYKKARAGIIKNFTGISSPFEEPENADIVVYTDKESLDESTLRVLEKVLEKL